MKTCERLDFGYLARWAKSVEVLDRLERARLECTQDN
jgi:hypothetical protein